MSGLLSGILILLVIWLEWTLVKTALAPLIDIAVAIYFIAKLTVVLVVEVGLIVIAPTALFLGFESRQWHRTVALKFMGGGKTNDTD